MAQLVERSLPTPEVRGSNPDIGKRFYRIFVYCFLSTVMKRRKIKKNRPGMAILKSTFGIRRFFPEMEMMDDGILTGGYLVQSSANCATAKAVVKNVYKCTSGIDKLHHKT